MQPAHLTVKCTCGTRFQIPASRAGGTVACPSCNKVHDVPADWNATPPPQPIPQFRQTVLPPVKPDRQHVTKTPKAVEKEQQKISSLARSFSSVAYLLVIQLVIGVLIVATRPEPVLIVTFAAVLPITFILICGCFAVSYLLKWMIRVEKLLRRRTDPLPRRD